MRLLIISHMPHYRRADGRIVGWGPTVQELDHLATRFDDVRHIACLHEGEPPASFLPYKEDRVHLVPVPPTGGDHMRDKLGVLAAAPQYISTMLRELPHADMVHLRCPANVPMIGAMLLPFVRKPRARWIKYAGNWRPAQRGSLPFAFQRWFLSHRWHRGTVTINGTWPGQPAHVKSFYNPSLTNEELASASAAAHGKRLTMPLHLLFVGRLEAAKGPETALDTLAMLVGAGIDATLELAGDGPDRAACEQRAERLGIGRRVTFHGWLSRDQLGPLYARAQMMLFPTRSEGWPKVLSEGMAYGVVPIATAVGAIPQYLSEFGVGRALPETKPELFAEAIGEYVRDPARFARESADARERATSFSYSYYLREIDRLLAEIT
jgi:glycosyltransferase involved in cell wall biosynthesis